LAKRGLPKPGHEGDLYAIAQIAVPHTTDEREKELYTELSKASTFNPRAGLEALTEGNT
jgi:curved DNA-binding protein